MTIQYRSGDLMPDMIIRGMANKEVRFFIADCTELVKKAAKIHDLSLGNAVVFGKLLCAGILAGADLKSEKDLLTIKIDGDGPSGKALVTVNSKCYIKGIISNPGSETQAENKSDFIDRTVLGKGSIIIIKDLGLKAPYSGQTEMIYGNIAQDITYYYAKSEQIPTSVGLGVLVFPDGRIKKAGGFLIQLLPNFSDTNAEILEKNISSFPNLTDVLDMGYSLEHIIQNMLLKSMTVEIMGSAEPSYKCGCSRSKMKKAVRLLKKSEIEDELTRTGFIEVKCHFCNRSYKFRKEELDL
jgi:molecular chaperone Hsp33